MVSLLFIVGASPCWVWFNSNETIRNAGDTRANQLSAMLKQIVATEKAHPKYKNFDIEYLSFNYTMTAVSKIWYNEYNGKGLWQLINKSDGYKKMILSKKKLY